jgi:hypothetical protein
MLGSTNIRTRSLRQYGPIMNAAEGIATLAEGDGRDIQILFDPEGGFNGSPISMTTFTDILRITSEEISKEFIKLAAAYKGDLIHLYSKAFRDRPRREGMGLRAAILEAIAKQQTEVGQAGEAELGVFDLEEARRNTSGPEYGFKRNDGNLFDLAEAGSDGTPGYIKGNPLYGFVSQRVAVKLAYRAARWAKLKRGWDDGAVAAFVERIKEAFGGRLDDEDAGIMVPLLMPLFIALPAWGGDGTRLRLGSEFTHAQPFPVPAMNILSNYQGPMDPGIAAAGGDVLGEMMGRVMANVAKRIKGT